MLDVKCEMYGCENFFTMKKGERWRIDAFELWCWRRLLRVPWTMRRSIQSILKEITWVFIGRTDAKAETPILWPPHAKSWLIGKISDAGRAWGQEEKGTTEDEMAGWHHWLDGHEFEYSPGVGEEQGGEVCCDSWGPKESGRTERLYWTVLLGSNCLRCFLLFSFLFHLLFICLPNAELATYNSPLTIQPNWCPDIFKCPLGKKSLQCSMTSIANFKYYSLFKWKTQSLTELGRISAWEDLEIHLKVKADSKLSRRINN